MKLLVGIAILLPASLAVQLRTEAPTTASPTFSPAPTVSSSPTQGPTTAAQCTVCADSQDYDQDREYPNWGMKCSQLGNAQAFGLTCGDIQSIFGVFCGCPGATSDCGVCGSGGEAPPNPDLVIPGSTTTTTCDDIHRSASIRSAAQCQSHLNSLDYDASAYCGCSATNSPASDRTEEAFSKKCSFCPGGQSVEDGTLVPEGSQGATCSELESFAPYVVDDSYCTFVKGFAVDCCSSIYSSESSSYYTRPRPWAPVREFDHELIP